MLWFVLVALVLLLWNARLMHVNDRLRKRTASDVMWDQFYREHGLRP